MAAAPDHGTGLRNLPDGIVDHRRGARATGDLPETRRGLPAFSSPFPLSSD